MVVERKSGIQHDESRVGGDESAANVIPDNAIADVYIASDVFWTDSGTLGLAACPIFWG